MHLLRLKTAQLPNSRDFAKKKVAVEEEKMPLFTLTTSLFSFRAGEREGRGREPPEEREEKTPLFTVPGNAEKKVRKTWEKARICGTFFFYKC